jgi:two-component system phosphate regulon response regulator OmpR
MEEALDGEECKRKVKSFLPNLIFLDIHVPGENGLALARQIKSDYPAMIIVVFTSYDLPEYRLASLQSGCDFFVPKDLWTGEEILTLIESVISRKTAEDSSTQARFHKNANPENWPFAD